MSGRIEIIKLLFYPDEWLTKEVKPFDFEKQDAKVIENQMITLNALIVIDVHARDVTEKLLKVNTTDPGAFDWIS